MTGGGRVELIPGRFDVLCACWRRSCKHKRAEEIRYLARKTEADQLNALTDTDVLWLRDMGWRG